jgi:hypothetical protein
VRFLTALRRSPVIWLAAPVLVVAFLFAGGAVDYKGSDFGGYTVFWTCRAALGVTGGLAALAAWEAGRLRAGAVWRLAPGRGRYRIGADALRPVLALALAADAAALANAARLVGAGPRTEDAAAVAVVLAVQGGLIVAGFGLGTVLPRVVAPPAALIGVTLWLAVPATLGTPWVRYLNGMFNDPPTVTDDLAPRVLVAPVLVAGGVVAAVLLASLPLRGRLLRAGVAVACLAAGAVPAQALVADSGYATPMVPRTGAQRCLGDAPPVCVPEELSDTLPRLRAAADQALPRLASAGVARPERISYASQNAHLDANSWRIYVQSPLSAEQALVSVSSAVVPAPPRCPALPDDYPRPDPRPLTGWLLLVAGVDGHETAGLTGTAAAREATRVRAQPAGVQRGWFRAELAKLGSCAPRVMGTSRR